MENYYSIAMAKKSDSELKEIITQKNNYQDKAYIAAIDELEKRNLASQELLKDRENTINCNERKISIEKQRIRNRTKILNLLKPSKKYIFTPVIIYINFIVFFLMVFNGVHPLEPSAQDLHYWGGNLRISTITGEQWRLITSLFLHGGIIHLLFNMYALINIGGFLEKRLGKVKFLFIYITTGIFSSITSIAFNENIVSIGASGAIFGIYGLFLALLITKVLNIPEESRKNFITSILYFIGFNLFYGFTREGIDNAAHIGGLLSGFIIGWLFHPSIKKSRKSLKVSISITVVLFCGILFMPKFITNRADEFQNTIAEFGELEQRALWMYSEDLSSIPTEKKQYYYEKLDTEGIKLWEESLKLLNSLDGMPKNLQNRVDLLIEYCNLRLESCKIMQRQIMDNNFTEQEKIDEISKDINQIIDSLIELNQ